MTAYNILVDGKRYCMVYEKEQANGIVFALIKKGKNAEIQEFEIKKGATTK